MLLLVISDMLVHHEKRSIWNVSIIVFIVKDVTAWYCKGIENNIESDARITYNWKSIIFMIINDSYLMFIAFVIEE